MEKLDFIEDYFNGVQSYYLYWCGTFSDISMWKEKILDKKYLNAAKVSFISNIMLGIKEDLVSNLGNRVYESKLFIEALENSVMMIATKVSNGYKIGNYVFPDAATLIAIIRNKLAHGKYVCDLEHNRVIITHEGQEIILNIQKLINLIMMAFRNKIMNEKSSCYERNIFSYTNDDLIHRTDRLKDLNEARRVIRGYNEINFKLENLNGMPVFPECIEAFNKLLKYISLNLNTYMQSDYYKNVCNYFKKMNCKLTIEYRNMKKKDDIDHILKFVEYQLLDNEELDYSKQVKLIGYEVQRRMRPVFNNFNPLMANIKHIIFLDAISKTNSVLEDELTNYLVDKLGIDLHFQYDEFGMVLISLFNSLFMYLYDDVYSVSGEYTLDRSSGLDFGKLDLSLLKPNVIPTYDSPLVLAKEKMDGLDTRIHELEAKINQQKINLVNVSGKSQIESKIKQSIVDLENAKALADAAFSIAKASYDAILNDLTDNQLYFKNKAIIEGIRNSIAHGHYDIISNGSFADTEILFSDIYEGDLTFQLRIKFSDFEEFLNNNIKVIESFINDKIDTKEPNVLSRK